MNEEKAKKYLKKHGKDPNDQKLVDEVIKSGKIFGDPSYKIDGM